MHPIFDRALFLLSVPKCVACGERLSYGELALCASCMSKYRDVKSRNCSVCSKKLSECGCANKFLSSHFVKSVAKVFRYFPNDNERPENRLIFSLKQDNRYDVISLCASELSEAISNLLPNPEDCIFTNVPRRRSAIKKYGYDHSAMLAKRLAKSFDATYMPLLYSKSKSMQKSLHGDERLKNVKFDYKRCPDLTGKTVIIVDDVITTGASMGRAAMLIRGLGAKKIHAAALAIAYKDDYIPFAKE